MTDAARFVYVTATDRVEAVAIGWALVSERLAACANIIDPVASIYWWEGAVHEGAEAVLVLKSRADLIAPLIERVKALPIDAGNPAYLDWIVAETTSR